MLRPALAFVVSATLFVVTETHAQERWQEQVDAQIEASSVFLASEGFRLAHQVQRGSLDDTEANDLWIDLRGGMEYAIVGVCDQDCTDIDLEIFDGDNSVDSDYEVDDTPVLQVAPAYGAEYRLHVYMANCRTEPCYYGVGIYGREVAGATREVSMSDDRGESGRWGAQVERQMDRASDAFRREGFRQTHEMHAGTLEDEAAEDFYIRLRAGSVYALLGVCDEDCDDIDLAIYDENGQEIDSDYQTDDVPLVRVTPWQTGQFRVHVYMASCHTAPCYYGVGVFGQVGQAR
jgi:hypothetical protein